VETARRSQLADAAAHYRRSHSRWFWGMRLYLLAAPDLGLGRHCAKTLHGLRNRIATKLLALAAGVWLNHYLGRPTRAFASLAT
jgi:hypothetical protein